MLFLNQRYKHGDIRKICISNVIKLEFTVPLEHCHDELSQLQDF